MSNTLFPIFLKTDNLRFLVVGGGNVGLEKTQTLLRQNPATNIRIIALEFHPELLKIAWQQENVIIQKKPFEVSDLDHCDIVITAIDDPHISREIRQHAREKRLLVNAADQPELCDFYLGSIVQKGNLKIAFSTNGKSPVLARRLREFFEDVIPDEIENSIDQLHEIRNQMKDDLKYRINELNRITAILHQKEKSQNN